MQAISFDEASAVDISKIAGTAVLIAPYEVRAGTAGADVPAARSAVGISNIESGIFSKTVKLFFEIDINRRRYSDAMSGSDSSSHRAPRNTPFLRCNMYT